MATRETKDDKALRLISGQRVRFRVLNRAGCEAEVAGDGGDYTVTLNGRWGCTCEHGSNSRALCSHALAASIIYRAVVGAI